MFFDKDGKPIFPKLFIDGVEVKPAENGLTIEKGPGLFETLPHCEHCRDRLLWSRSRVMVTLLGYICWFCTQRIVENRLTLRTVRRGALIVARRIRDGLDETT